MGRHRGSKGNFAPPIPMRYLREGRTVADPDTHCWLWRGLRNRDGYGVVRIDYRPKMLHRVMYEHFLGDIPDGLFIDHLCRVRHCINPGHLEVVTVAENNRRAALVKTHCPQGHPYEGANLRIASSGKTSYRACRACNRESSARHRSA